jgi:hypothetical protein
MWRGIYRNCYRILTADLLDWLIDWLTDWFRCYWTLFQLQWNWTIIRKSAHINDFEGGHMWRHSSVRMAGNLVEILATNLQNTITNKITNNYSYTYFPGEFLEGLRKTRSEGSQFRFWIRAGPSNNNATYLALYSFPVILVLVNYRTELLA